MSRAQKTQLDILFVDTSISIARLLQGHSIRDRIERTTAKFRTCSGLVSRQEFKRRVLKDARYLLDVLDRRGGFEDSLRYLNGIRPYQNVGRKAAICIDLMADITGNDDHEKTDRLRCKLIRLLKSGLVLFDSWFDCNNTASQCWCGKQNVTVRQKGSRKEYEFGGERCSALTTGQCGIASLIAICAVERKKILNYLQSLPATRKTSELTNAEKFLMEVEADPTTAESLDPCLKVGDLVIALESVVADAKVVYTMNGRESQHLCRALGQGLVVSPPDPDLDDVECLASDPDSWRDFGPKAPT